MMGGKCKRRLVAASCRTKGCRDDAGDSDLNGALYKLTAASKATIAEPSK